MCQTAQKVLFSCRDTTLVRIQLMGRVSSAFKAADMSSHLCFENPPFQLQLLSLVSQRDTKTLCHSDAQTLKHLDTQSLSHTDTQSLRHSDTGSDTYVYEEKGKCDVAGLAIFSIGCFHFSLTFRCYCYYCHLYMCKRKKGKCDVAVAGNCETLRRAKHLSGSIQSGSEYISTSAITTKLTTN